MKIKLKIIVPILFFPFILSIVNRIRIITEHGLYNTTTMDSSMNDDENDDDNDDDDTTRLSGNEDGLNKRVKKIK